jgi:hypothetical protein
VSCPCSATCCTEPTPAIAAHICRSEYCECIPETECQACGDTCKCVAIQMAQASMGASWPSSAYAGGPTPSLRPSVSLRTRDAVSLRMRR